MRAIRDRPRVRLHQVRKRRRTTTTTCRSNTQEKRVGTFPDIVHELADRTSQVNNFPRAFRNPGCNRCFARMAEGSESQMQTQVMSPKSSTRSLPWVMARCSSTIRTTISSFSRKPRTRTRQFGVPTVFLDSVSHVFS